MPMLSTKKTPAPIIEEMKLPTRVGCRSQEAVGDNSASDRWQDNASVICERFRTREFGRESRAPQSIR